jgi:PKD repeat protein
VTVLATATAAAVAGSCGGGGARTRDAGIDRPVADDASSVVDSVATPLVLDFAATGCMAFDLGTPRCDGIAPLTLTFTPIASDGLSRFLWDFGDGTASSSDRSPAHSYALPGRYTVSLVAGGSAGTLSRNHEGFVNVTPAGIGDRCDVDLQCAADLGCLCGTAAPCLPVVTGGVCARPCDDDTAACAAGGPDGGRVAAVCADLSAGSAPGADAGTEAWRRRLCLRSCVRDGDCARGLRCRHLPGASPASWIQACFVDHPGAVGARCADPSGKLSSRECATGVCADLGLYGRCSATCATSTDCPTGTGCARFGDGRTLCIADCTAAPCNDDPALGCELPGAAGPQGFVILGEPATAGTSGAEAVGPSARSYCAPKSCAGQDPCGAAARCISGHCLRSGAPDAASPG